MVVSQDPLHRCVNDFSLAVSSTKLHDLRMNFAVVVNCRIGPFGKSRNHAVLNAAAAEMFERTTFRNEAYQLLYPRICWELGFCNDPDYMEVEHYQKVWSHLQEVATRPRLGEPVKLSRWWALETRAKQMKQSGGFGCMLLILVWVGYRQRWWKTLADSPLLSKGAVFSPDADGQPDFERELEEEEEQEHGDNSKEGARVRLRERRRKCRSTLLFCAHMLACDSDCRLFMGMVHLTEPLHTWTAECMRAAKDRGAMEQWVQQTALGTQVQLASTVGNQFFTEAVCRSLGGLDATEEPQHRVVEGLGAQLWSLTVNIMGEVAETSLLRTLPPLVFAPLLHPNGDIAARALQTAKTMWETLSKLEETACTHSLCFSGPESCWWSCGRQTLNLLLLEFARLCVYPCPSRSYHHQGGEGQPKHKMPKKVSVNQEPSINHHDLNQPLGSLNWN